MADRYDRIGKGERVELAAATESAFAYSLERLTESGRGKTDAFVENARTDSL